MVKKTCTRCKEEKPLSGFYCHPKTVDGRQSWCKDCAKAVAVEGKKQKKVVQG
jgi:hypothetical protein